MTHRSAGGSDDNNNLSTQGAVDTTHLHRIQHQEESAEWWGTHERTQEFSPGKSPSHKGSVSSVKRTLSGNQAVFNRTGWEDQIIIDGTRSTTSLERIRLEWEAEWKVPGKLARLVTSERRSPITHKGHRHQRSGSDISDADERFSRHMARIGEIDDRRKRREEKEQRYSEDYEERLHRVAEWRIADMETDDDVLQLLTAWHIYDSRWLAIETSPGTALQFRNFPWPVVDQPKAPGIIDDKLTPRLIAEFLLSPHHSDGMNYQQRLEKASERWSIRAFEDRILRRFPSHAERRLIRIGVELVEKALEELLVIYA